MTPSLALTAPMIININDAMANATRPMMPMTIMITITISIFTVLMLKALNGKYYKALIIIVQDSVL